MKMYYKVKLLLSIFFFLICSIVHGQSFLVPKLDKNNRFGLVNEKGKQIVKPIYDQIEWVDDKLFIAGIDKDGAVLNDLIFDGKVIVKSTTHSRFLANDGIINAVSSDITHFSTEQRRLVKAHSNTYSDLFNTNGKKLFDKSFVQVHILDTATFNTEKQILIFGYDINKRHNLYVYKCKKLEIVPLIEDADKITLTDRHANSFDGFPFSIIDKEGFYTEQIIARTEEGYAFVKKAEERVPSGYGAGELGTIEESSGRSEGGLYMGKKGSQAEGNNSKTTPYEYVRYSLRADGNSIHIYKNAEKTDAPPITLADNQHIMYREYSGNYNTIIYQEDNNYGYITQKGDIKKPEYELLQYYQYDHIVAKKNGKQGIIDYMGNIVLPLEYDSLKFADNRLTYDEEKKHLQIISPDESQEKAFRYSSYILAGKNGKVGLLDARSFKEYIPVIYDSIFYNKLFFKKESTNYILKKDGLYYLLSHQKQPLPGGFQYYPLSYVSDYYGIKGLRLYGLYDDNLNFKGYAKEDGKKY